MKTRLSGAILLIIVILTVMICIDVPAFAKEENPNVYVYVPVKTGNDAVALLSNNTDDSGGDASIVSNGENEVSIEFAAGQKSGGTAERKRTTVDLDISSVSNHKLKYVSFDITLDSFMDFVASFDPYDIDSDIEYRPHSLYFTDSGYMASTQHARKYKYETKSDADGYKTAITDDWWINSKITQPYSVGKSINVKMIASSMTGNTVNISGTDKKRLEYDEVQIYINGVRNGQFKTVNKLDPWESEVLSFSHYTTLDSKQSIRLENLEIGFCERKGKDETNLLDPNVENKTWSFTEGNNTYISITLPTTGDNAYYVQPSIDASGSSFMWFKNMGVLSNWGSGAFNADGTCGFTLDTIKGWHNIHAWEGTSEVTVTYEINKGLGTVECYDNLGHWRKVYRNNLELPTSVSIQDVVGDVKPTKVVSGVFAEKGLNITDADGTPINEFAPNSEKVNISAFGVTQKNQRITVLYAWRNAGGNLLKVESRSMVSDRDGLYTLSYGSGFGSAPPNGAAYINAYVWDENYRPLYTAVRADKALEIYTTVQSYEVENNGRYRVCGRLNFNDPICEKNVFAVFKNGEKVWEQLVTVGKPQTLDIRMSAEKGDNIEVKTGTFGGNTYDYSDWSCDIYRYIGTLPCEASTSVGFGYKKLKQMSFGSLIGTAQGENGAEFYSVRLGLKKPMVYDRVNNKWKSPFDGDRGSIQASEVSPGSEWAVGSDTVMELTLSSDGIMRIDGDFSLCDESSDGVLANIYLNDKLLWSNRVGGARAVRWDEPFDVSYFLDEVNVVANVKSGDKLKFTFNRWRKSGNDRLSVQNVKLTYIKGEILSETTKWKLSRSIAIDLETCTVYSGGIERKADVLCENGTAYISESGVHEVFGNLAIDKVPCVTINGGEYMPLKELAENNGRYVAEIDDKTVLIHDNIPVFYGFSEISEIRTATENGENIFNLIK